MGALYSVFDRGRWCVHTLMVYSTEGAGNMLCNYRCRFCFYLVAIGQFFDTLLHVSAHKRSTMLVNTYMYYYYFFM
jgi:hypothetical protein